MRLWLKRSIKVSNGASEPWHLQAGVDERFRPLVERLAREAIVNPAVYRRKVVAAAFIGYVFITLVVVALCAVVALSFAGAFYFRGAAGFEVKFGLVTGLIALGLARSMFVRAPEPEGRQVTEAEVPALFASIDRLRRSVDGPKIDAVYLTDELNASMGQSARVGPFGSRNVLSIGLPLMAAVTDEELSSVIAHELGHSVGGHGKWAGFVYRVRIRWMQVGERLQTGIVASLVGRFFRWYGPWFNAYSFVLARSQEYEADAVASRATSARATASSLIRVEVQSQRFGEHWQKVWNESRSQLAPNRMPYQEVQDSFRISEPGDQSVLNSALECATDLNDTHPCLADRLRALGQKPELPAPIERSAARALLGNDLASFIGRLDEEWWSTNRDWWASCNEAAKEENEERRALESAISEGNATVHQRERYIELVQSSEGNDRVQEARRDALHQYPGAHNIRYVLGIGLLETNVDEGIAQIREAIDSSPSLAVYGYSAIVSSLERLADPRLDEFRTLAAQSEADNVRLMAESQSLDDTVALEPFVIDPADRETLRARLAAIDGLKRLSIAQRTLRSGERQIICLFKTTKEGIPMIVLDEILPVLLDYGDTLAMHEHWRNRWLARRIQAISESELLPR